MMNDRIGEFGYLGIEELQERLPAAISDGIGFHSLRTVHWIVKIAERWNPKIPKSLNSKIPYFLLFNPSSP